MNGTASTAQVRLGSLSLRLIAVFVAILVAGAFAVGYALDRTRSEAMEQRALERLRLHTERGADELEHLVRKLRGDALFLADTPPIQGIRRALEAGGADVAGGSTLGQWQWRLQQIFLSFARARPEYFQLRLIGIGDHGRELVRVERTPQGLAVKPPEGLQQKGDRYYVQEGARLTSGAVHLSRIDLNREHGEIALPHLPTLRATTPVYDPDGKIFGVVVLNLDMGWAFLRIESFRDPEGAVYIATEHGDFLHHPEPGRAFAFEFGAPFRLADAFADDAQRIPLTLSDGSAFLELNGPKGKLAAYFTSRAWDTQDSSRRLVFIATEPMQQVMDDAGIVRGKVILAVGAVLVLAIALLVVVVHRLTRSLTALAAASGAIANGQYRVALPRADSREIHNLELAFRRMAREVEQRESALAQANRELERRVEERTAELARQHALQQLILENIADGVVVADCEGHFLLWNRKAEQIVGSGPNEVPSDHWSPHFGVFRDEACEPIPTSELPLVRAMRGESSDNVELYLRNPKGQNGRWARVTARPLLDAAGGISGGVAVLIDVTEHKRLCQRVEAHSAELAKVAQLALRAEIASAAAHQLSQPIAAVSNYAGAALRLHKQGRLGGEELLELLSKIESLTGQAGEALNRLRASIRRWEPLTVPVDINRVADACLDFLHEKILRQGVRVERRYGSRLPRVNGAPVELEHVLIQVVSNALDAMAGIARTERHLSIGTRHDAATDQVVIEIADSGTGLSEMLADRLFDPWETTKQDALGIGLSVAQTIVETHQGRIHAENRAGGGALFRIELPIASEGSA